MTDREIQLTLRLGTHAEKEYVEKMSPFLGGVIFGANLMESTPGATASLVVSLAGAKRKLPYYIDPMTYAFGEYVDRGSGEICSNLDWLKSDQKVKGEKGKTERKFKSSYVALGGAFGSVIGRAMKLGQAVTPEVVSGSADPRDLVREVLEYQQGRVRREFESDEEFRKYAADAPLPAAVFAPYFYCEPTKGDAWLDVNVLLAREAASRGSEVPVHAILCADESHLLSSAFVDRLITELPRTGVAGVWLWFSRFDETIATLSHLRSFRRIVEELAAKGLEVHNLHGGYFSLALSKLGLAGISHGVGYGEQKDVVPVLGQSVPTVRYYLPALYRRVGVASIDRAFDRMGVKSVADFHEKVCGCAVCRGVVVARLAEFGQYFGETRPSSGKSDREVQTPQAARRCRFHFLLNRLKECREIDGLTLLDLQRRFDETSAGWGAQPTLSSDSKHLGKWRAALG